MVTKRFDIHNLVAAYDKNRLVPFIGSGMSRPVCPDWGQLIGKLETWCGLDKSQPQDNDLIRRAQYVVQLLRQKGNLPSAALNMCLYEDREDETTLQSDALASVFWPLVCTTNYDDIYLKSKFKYLYKRELSIRRKQSIAREKIKLPKIRGRSEIDSHRVIQHLNFPDGEVVWALQGFLSPSTKEIRDKIIPDTDITALEQEIVLGHADYRRASHRSPHFRRCFGEAFRRCSFFFLGSGLSEPYFRSIFDEIIELVGPPDQPHFALIEEGSVDTEFLQHQYHILCDVYPKGQNPTVTNTLNEFRSKLSEGRARSTKWGFRMTASQIADRIDSDEHFCVIRAPLPRPEIMGANEAMGISCGRASTDDGFGRPLVSRQGFDLLNKEMDFSWCSSDHWVVKWSNTENLFGIVARDQLELTASETTSRDRRNPEAIRNAFTDFLIQVDARGLKLAHVQLLAAGESRVWAPWVSLVQMARAYGQWLKSTKNFEAQNILRVRVYVVDLSLISLLQGGALDLRPELECAPLHIRIETIDALGGISISQRFVSPDERLSELLSHLSLDLRPMLSAYPKPRLMHKNYDQSQSVGEFGLVSGSTLTVDFRNLSR